MQRCMRVAACALALSATCLDIVNGFVKSPGASVRYGRKATSIRGNQGGALRGVDFVPAAVSQAEPPKPWGIPAGRMLSTLRGGEIDPDVDEDGAMSVPSGDNDQQTTEALSVATKVEGGASKTAARRGCIAEMKKVVPLAAMFFFIFFNYVILRDTKDILIVTAPGLGAEMIPFLRTYVSLPAAVAFAAVYSKLNNILSPSNVFYAVITPFLAFFAAFAAFLYPARDYLHPHAAADYLLAHLPVSYGPLISIFRNWTYTAFYTAAELWGSVVMSVLFWGLANQVMTTSEAKRYYPLCGLAANVTLIFSGEYVRFVTHIRASLPAHVDKWAATIELLMAAVCTLGVGIVGIHHHIQKSVMSDPECVPAEVERPNSKPATSMGLLESATYLAKSKYIRDLAMLVMAHGMSVIFLEYTWKASMKKAFHDRNAYLTFMGSFSTATGIVTVAMTLLGRLIFQKFGCVTAALVTPTVLALSSIFFFPLIIFEKTFAPLLALFGTTPLMAAVLIGAAQNVLLTSSKSSLFDPSKEMAYINLDAEQKIKGKALIDLIGTPLARSGGAFIVQDLIKLLGSLPESTPCLAALLVNVILIWFASAKSLGSMIDRDGHHISYTESSQPPCSSSKEGLAGASSTPRSAKLIEPSRSSLN